ncbi:MAG: class II fructose-bisphosphate aldolase [Blastocatellia bacterium]
MKGLRDVLADTEQRRVAIGHFNASDESTIKTIFETARKLSLTAAREIPVIVGASEGEREFQGAFEVASFVRFLRTHYDYPIFINADHTHSFEKAEEAIEAGFDEVLFDGASLPLQENIAATRRVVEVARRAKRDIIVEGELGYIGSGSVMLDSLPQGAALSEDSITRPEAAATFVHATGVDMFAPAVGNIHGMLKNAPNPHLFIKRIREIKQSVRIPMVLHGGSGIPDQDFVQAIDAGINIIHISTELRRAWRNGIEESLRQSPEEVVPFKLLGPAYERLGQVVDARLRLFNKQAAVLLGTSA